MPHDGIEGFAECCGGLGCPLPLGAGEFLRDRGDQVRPVVEHRQQRLKRPLVEPLAADVIAAIVDVRASQRGLVGHLRGPLVDLGSVERFVVRGKRRRNKHNQGRCNRDSRRH